MLSTMLAASFEKQEVRIFKNQKNQWISQGTLKEQQERIEL
jgi:hypothetical protein